MDPIRKVKKMMGKFKVGLALGSGGARGYAHIGAIKALEQYNIPIDYISGASIGSIIGAHYALFKDIKKTEEIAVNFNKKEVLKFMDLNNPAKSIIKGFKVKKYLNEIFENKTFEDTKIPLRIVATALEDGSPYIFNSGKLADAALASSSIPGIFPPVKCEDKNLVDGGLSDAVPIKSLKQFSPDIIIGVDLYSIDLEHKKNYGLKDMLIRTYQITLSKFSEYAEFEKNTIVIKPKLDQNIEFFDFDKAERGIKLGYDETKNMIKEIKKVVK